MDNEPAQALLRAEHGRPSMAVTLSSFAQFGDLVLRSVPQRLEEPYSGLHEFRLVEAGWVGVNAFRRFPQEVAEPQAPWGEV